MILIRIATIVEGDGEVKAVPALIRRIGAEVAPLAVLEVVRPIRVPRGLFLKEGGLERYVNLAASRAGAGGRVLVLLDANGDCPAELAAVVLQRARAARPDRLIDAACSDEVLARLLALHTDRAAAEARAGTAGRASAPRSGPVDTPDESG